MKKIISILSMLFIVAGSLNAQTAQDLAKQQQQLNKILTQSINAKPTKEAKKLAKQLKKEGWLVPAGDRSIENQVNESLLLGAELTQDDNGNITHRFLQHTGQATAGTYNAAYAAARSNTMVEIASNLETEIAAAMSGKLDNNQSNSESALTNDKFNQRIKSIVHNSLSNSIPVMALYKILPNKNYQVQVRLAYDKKELAARIKRQMQKDMEVVGDELNGILDQALSGQN